MKKEATWVLLIALGVFLGVFAYEKYTMYRVQMDIQESARAFAEVM